MRQIESGKKRGDNNACKVNFCGDCTKRKPFGARPPSLLEQALCQRRFFRQAFGKRLFLFLKRIAPEPGMFAAQHCGAGKVGHLTQPHPISPNFNEARLAQNATRLVQAATPASHGHERRDIPRRKSVITRKPAPGDPFQPSPKKSPGVRRPRGVLGFTISLLRMLRCLFFVRLSFCHSHCFVHP